MILLLDNLGNLDCSSFGQYFCHEEAEGLLKKAMKGLSLQLQSLHKVVGLFVYCTGFLDWSTELALQRSTSPFLFVRPIILQPLSKMDLLDTLKETYGIDNDSDLATEMGLPLFLMENFLQQVIHATAGVGFAM